MILASPEEVPTEGNATATRTTAKTTPAKVFLSRVFYAQAVMSTFIGLLAVFLPSAFYAFESSPENQQPSPPEDFAIRCWGSFILGIGTLCIQHRGLTTDNQVVVGLCLILHYSSLWCLYLYEWHQLIYSYKIGSVPIFMPTTILWMVAVGRVVMEASSSTKKQN
jgi:hypothetical protein